MEKRTENEITKNNLSLTRWNFLLHTSLYFLLLTTFLVVIDFVPELDETEFGGNVLLASENKPLNSNVVLKQTRENIDNDLSGKDKESDDVLKKNKISSNVSQIPMRIVVEKIGLDTVVVEPYSNKMSVLDAALLKGAVHYPESGTLGENRNVLIFAHSSYLPVVRNKAFKTFNEIKKLNVGDDIKVYSNNFLFVYKVDSVELKKAKDVMVEFYSEKPKLTLTTCNSFGSEEERYVVKSSLIRKEKI